MVLQDMNELRGVRRVQSRHSIIQIEEVSLWEMPKLHRIIIKVNKEPYPYATLLINFYPATMPMSPSSTSYREEDYFNGFINYNQEHNDHKTKLRCLCLEATDKIHFEGFLCSRMKRNSIVLQVNEHTGIMKMEL